MAYIYSKSVSNRLFTQCLVSFEHVNKVLLIHSCQILGITTQEAEKDKKICILMYFERDQTLRTVAPTSCPCTH